MTNKTIVNNHGIGFFGLLTVLFIALKLLGYISWSWWAVLSPIWAPPVILITVFIIAFIFIWAIKTIKESFPKDKR